MKDLTAEERNREINRLTNREARRREEREFSEIPQRVKNILADVFCDRRVKDRYLEATERLRRRPTVVEWCWANKQEWE
jgi:hypothetical protein